MQRTHSFGDALRKNSYTLKRISLYTLAIFGCTVVFVYIFVIVVLK